MIQNLEDERMKQKDKDDVEKPIIYYYAKQIGILGTNTSSPIEKDAYVHIYEDRIEVELLKDKSRAIIPYKNMTHLQNLDTRDKEDIDRVIGTGNIPGFLWKGHDIITAIKYTDDARVSQIMAIDFLDDTEYAHPLIYKKMQEAFKPPDQTINQPAIPSIAGELSKHAIFTGKELAFLILIIIPLSITIVVFISPTFAFWGYSYYFMVALSFGLSPLSYSMSKYFRKRGYEKGIVQFGFVKKIIYLLVPIIILLLALNILIKPASVEETPPSVEETPPSVEETLRSWLFLTRSFEDYLSQVTLAGVWGFALMGGLIWIVILSRKEDFEFYFARVFIVIASKEKNKTKKAKYFIKCLKFYDRYLRRTLNLQINDIKEIYSKVIIDSNIDQEKEINSLSLAFETDNDRLKPAKWLSEIVNVDDPKKFLTEESIGKRLKDLIIFFATIIPVAIAIIQLFLLFQGITGTQLKG